MFSEQRLSQPGQKQQLRLSQAQQKKNKKKKEEESIGIKSFYSHTSYSFEYKELNVY